VPATPAIVKEGSLYNSKARRPNTLKKIVVVIKALNNIYVSKLVVHNDIERNTVTREHLYNSGNFRRLRLMAVGVGSGLDHVIDLYVDRRLGHNR
jgi:hypothetical protein